MGLDDITTCRQTDSGATLARFIGAAFGAVERIEDLGQLVAGNAHTVVGPIFLASLYVSGAM